MKHPGLRFTLFILLFSALLTLPASAQVGANFTIVEINTDAYPEISALVSVANFGGAPIAGLSEQFSVKEDGQSLPLSSVEEIKNPEQPISIALVLDLSGSAPLEDVKTAAIQFLDYLGPADKISLIGFNTPPGFDSIDPFKETDFTNNKDVVRSTIQGLTIQPESAVYEAVHKAILNTSAETGDRRAVLVMTDGFDTASRDNIANANTPREAARERNIPVFTVGVYSNDPALGQDPDYLKVLARESGGGYQEANTPSEMGGLFQNVVDQLRLQYRLTFNAQQLRDGQAHELSFTANFTEGPVTVAESVAYPAPTTVPEITEIKVGLDGALQALPDTLRGQILLVPQIFSEIPLIRVEYQVNGETTHTVEPSSAAEGAFEPWEWQWDTGPLEAGSYQLTVIAVDQAGSSTTFNLDNLQVGPLATATPEETPPTTTPPPVETVVTGEGEDDGGGINLLMLIGLGLFIVAFIIVIVIILLMRKNKSKENAQGGFETDDNLFSTDLKTGPTDWGVGDDVTPFSDMDHLGDSDFTQVEGGATDMAGNPGEDKTFVLTPDEDQTVILSRRKPLLGTLKNSAPGGKTYELKDSVTRIGRAKDNQIALSDSSVSRKHARIELQGQNLRVFDEGASNPTTVNGQKVGVQGHPLNDNDKIKLGRITLIFKKASKK